MSNSPELDHDEIDVTELIERIAKLEKENSEIKKIIEITCKRVTDCEDSIDAIAAKF